MSKTLYLLRHAKAGLRVGGQRDRDRELTERGRREAAALGRQCAAAELPARVITSSAARAAQTAALWAQAAGLSDACIVAHDGIYQAAAEYVLGVIRNLDAGLERVLLVGHNPAFSDLSTHLSSQFVALPTCAMAVLRVGGSWVETGPATARLLRIDRGR